MPASLPTAPAPKRPTTSPPGSSASPAGRTPASRRRRSSSTPAAALSPCTSPSITRRPLAMPTRSFRAVASAWPIAWRGATWRASAAFHTCRPPPPTPRWAPPHDRRSPDRGRPRLPRHPLPSPGPPALRRAGLRRPAGGGAARRRPGAAGPYRLRPPAPWRCTGGHARRPAAAAARAAPRSAPRRYPANEHGARAAAPRPAGRRHHHSCLRCRRTGGGASSRQPLAPAHRARLSARGAGAMSTTGQSVGGIIGAITGAILGGPTGAIYGAQIGMTIGGLLDPPKGPSQHGPSPDQLRLTTSTYGANIPRVYGTCPVAGNVVWLEGDKYRVKKKKSGGKGGGSVTTYKIFATFAVVLCEGPIVGLRRLWLGSELVYDGAAATTAGVIKSGKSKSSWKLYTGTDTQQPDPRYQADKGANAASGWPGLAYLVFYDLPLEKWQNTLAGVQIKAEVVQSGTTGWATIGAMSMTGLYSQNPAFTGFCSYFGGNGGYYFEPLWDNNYNQYPYTLRVWYIGLDLSKKLMGIVSSGVSSGEAVTCTAVMDIPACVVRFASGSPGNSFYILKKDGVGQIFSIDSSYGFSQLLVRKLGDDVIVTSYLKTTPNLPIRRYAYSTGILEAVSATPANKYIAIDVFEDEVYAVDATGLLSIFDKESLTINTTIAAPSGFTETESARLAVTGDRSFYLCSNGKYWIYADVAWSLLFIASDGYESQKALFALGSTLVSAESATTKVYGGSLTTSQVALDSVVQSECLQSNLLTAGDLDVTGLSADSVRGFRVSDTAPIRASLEPLSMIWPFDVRMHGYKLQCVRRGSASVASVPAADLDARMEESDPGPLLTLPRDMDTQLPQKVVLGFLDVDREYDRGEQESARYNTDARNIAEPEVAVVLNAQEGKRASEVLLYNYWRERGADITFSLPPAYLHLEPADVVTVTAPDGASHVLRLTNVNTTPAGIQECTARRDQPGGYTSSAVAETGAHTGAGLIVYGPTLDALLDIPALTADGNSPGFYAAACGVMPTWPGALLYASYSNGQDWEDVATWDADSFIGTVATSLGAATCFGRVDAAGTLTVSPYSSDRRTARSSASRRTRAPTRAARGAA